MPYFEYVGIGVGVMTALAAVLNVYWNYRRQNAISKEVRQAETRAFQDSPGAMEAALSKLTGEEGTLDEREAALKEVLETSKTIIQMGRLLDLYSKQIEKYQQQTRSRASISFFMAILAISAGLAFVVWGGTTLLQANETIMLAAGGVVAGIGGGISAYIAKTFLDVHRVSLEQLNRYFQQPVVNEHILMAQRMADDCDDDRTSNRAYEQIIESIASRIRVVPTGTGRKE